MDINQISHAEDLIEEGKLAEAKIILTELLSAGMGIADVLNDLAVIAIKENSFQDALNYLIKVIELDPGNETALNNLNFLNELLKEIGADETDIKTESGTGLSPIIEAVSYKKEVSIIIPVFNKIDLTKKCLLSLQRITTPVKFEVIVIDNASTDDTEQEIAALKTELSYELRYFKNETNLGFAKANNQAAGAAQYDILLFLNNDTLAYDDFLSEPVNLLENPGLGAVGCRLLYPDTLIQHCGIVFNSQKQPDHIFKFYPSDYPPANVTREVQAVTGACLFIPRALFNSVGGFDEEYVNGWEDMDLCFKIRETGRKIFYCAGSSIIHLESQSEGRLTKSRDNARLFYSRWREKVTPDQERLYSEVEERYSISSRKTKFNLPPQINFAIKIGVPSRMHKNWGDIFYAEALAREIRTAGHNCVIHYLDEWNQSDKNINAVIHIKGLSSYKLKPYNINILWIINHPELHTIDEINTYDIVFSASEKYYNLIKGSVTVPFYYLPQAADREMFKPDETAGEKDIDILFVGNNYEAKNNRCRKIISDLISVNKKFNLKIIGSGWEKFADKEYIYSEFADWDKLPGLYKRAKIVLNDHQETMRLNGFVNNRTFDLTALKVFQLSDYVEGLDELGIENYKTVKELEEKIEYYLADEAARGKKAEENFEKTADYNFKKRAAEILTVLKTEAVKLSELDECNICGYKGSGFLEMGVRKKVRCPVCSSLERQRALWYLLNRDHIIKPGMSVLEIAPLNNAVFRKFIEEKGAKYVCIDKWKHGNPLDMRDTAWIDYEMDICDLKFEDESFDLILMQHVIEEIPDDNLAFSEIARVLKKEGTAILEIPHLQYLRTTDEFGQAGKFGNMRQYGVDFYNRVSVFFPFRREVKIDGTPFSVFKKTGSDQKLSFPVFLDHPQIRNGEFELRFKKLLHLLNSKGYNTLTTAQAENLMRQRVYYFHPAWITFDDGRPYDYEQALPLLIETKNYATSFIIPGHLNDEQWGKWKQAASSRILDVQSHSLKHRRHFISSNVIDYVCPGNIPENMAVTDFPEGYPLFETDSCLAKPAFIPKAEVVDFAVSFYQANSALPKEEYLEKLKEELNGKFGSRLGVYEAEEEFQDRINNELKKSKEEIEKRIGSDVYAFSFPWGTYSDLALEEARNDYSLSVGVKPYRINENYDPYTIKRFDLLTKAYKEITEAFYRTRGWEKLELKGIPAVTVLMTTFNRRDSVADSIQSIINQTWKDWQLAVVNDGGEDIQDIIDTFDDPRIIYYNNEHKGKAAQLNFAISVTQSKYIAYLDDDDAYFPNHLEALISYLEAHSEIKFAYSMSQEISKIYVDHYWVEKERIIRYARQTNAYELRYNNHIPNLCALHRRGLFELAGLYDETLDVLIDWDMYRRLAVYAPPRFINLLTCEYSRKITTGNLAEGQITGLYYKDPVKYYKNRLRVLTKDITFDQSWIKSSNCVVIIINKENAADFEYFVYKIEEFKKKFTFDLVVIIDMVSGKYLIKSIANAEIKGAYVIWNHEQKKLNTFIDESFKNCGWQKYIFFDDLTGFNSFNLKDGIESKESRVKYLVKNSGKFLTEDILTLAMHKVSIVIPVFNKWKFTKDCLNALTVKNTNKVKFEIIIVDNNSADETAKELQAFKKKYKNIKVITNSMNLGFAKANNIGVEESTGDLILFLNNDTIPSGAWLDEMVLTMLSDNKIGIVGAKLLYPGGKLIQHAGVAIDDSPHPIFPFHIFHKQEAGYPPANYYRELQAVTAACMLVNKEVFVNAGRFDEEFINGYEDVDLCFKIRGMGFKIVYTPKTEIIHCESQSEGRFDNVEHNVKLLHSKWLNKIEKDTPEKFAVPVVSIIIPVYNQLQYTKQCFESIVENTFIPYEVIFIDNASTDGTAEYLKNLANSVVITNLQNEGYPKACNQGLAAAKGKYIVLLNNDTIVTPHWLEGLITVAESDPVIGMVGPAVNNISGYQKDYAAEYSSVKEIRPYAVKVRKSRKYAWCQTPRLAFVCALIKRELADKLGALDEIYSPGNFEDDDYCLRAYLAGYKIYIAFDVYIHHFGSKSFLEGGEQKYNDRLETNQKIFVEKWGASPEEIWLNGSNFRIRDVNIPLKREGFIQSFKEAIAFFEDGNFVGAAECLDKAILLYDEQEAQGSSVMLTDALHLAGNIALILEDIEKGRSYFEYELQLEPSSSRACTGLAETFMREKNYSPAKTMFEWGVKNDPGNDSAITGLAAVNKILGLPEKHNTLFEQGNN